MTLNQKSDFRFTLNNVRASHPHLFYPEVYLGKTKHRCITLLIPKTDAAMVGVIMAEIRAAILRKDGVDQVPQGNWCFRDGDALNKDGNPKGVECIGQYTLKANNRKPIKSLLNSDKSAITEENNPIYGGCYVNAVVEIWIQNNQHGRRVGCNIHGVQFKADGESFGGGDSPDVSDDFKSFAPVDPFANANDAYGEDASTADLY